jgi:hypothetical protein
MGTGLLGLAKPLPGCCHVLCALPQPLPPSLLQALESFVARSPAACRPLLSQVRGGRPCHTPSPGGAARPLAPAAALPGRQQHAAGSCHMLAD